MSARIARFEDRSEEQACLEMWILPREASVIIGIAIGKRCTCEREGVEAKRLILRGLWQNFHRNRLTVHLTLLFYLARPVQTIAPV